MDANAREQRIQTICLLILSTICVAASLYWLRPILIPFVLALFFSLGLAPIVEAQVRWLRMPGAIAVASTMLLLALVLALVGSLVSSSVGALSKNATAYQEQIVVTLERARNALPLDALGLEEASEGLDPFSIVNAGSISDLLVGAMNTVLDLSSRGLVVLVFTFFLLAGRAATRGRESTGVTREIEDRVKRYIVNQTLISAATGLLVWMILATIGVDLALVFGLFTFLLNFIPNIGSIIAVLLPLPVVLVSPEISTFAAVLAIVLPTLVQFVIGNVVAPKIIGDALQLHPVTILLALMFWGALWGIAGMLLAVPITAILRILMERFDVTEPLAHVLAGGLDEARARRARA
ncbi:MAG: AI-2E family transporter [Myxococcota bacterium]|jgi:AI-2 transport protein TqsA|nr:AI-2E family transporter [Myxococcota bacterium]